MAQIPSGPSSRLTTNDEWRQEMRVAREAQKLSQVDLAARVGVSQNVISKIESGQTLSSKAIRRIALALKIGLPRHSQDELAERWEVVGRQLREARPRLYEAELARLEELIRSFQPNDH